MEGTTELASKGGEAVEGGFEQEEMATEDVEEQEDGDGEDMFTFSKLSCGCWCFVTCKNVVPLPFIQFCCLY